MSEYARRFAENDIDLTLLGELTDQDLKELGVASLGHRRKILKAVAVLERASAAAPLATSAAPTPIPPAEAPTPIPSSADTAGERRYLTVMFCDLVGSTAISARLDAEEWRDLVGAYLDSASAAVTEMGGHVAKKARRRADVLSSVIRWHRRTTRSEPAGRRSRSNARSPS